MVLGSVLDWDSGSDSLAALAGVGTIGDTIGITAGEWYTTTTRISRTARLSSIGTVLTAVGQASITTPVSTAEPWGTQDFMGEPIPIQRAERDPAPSVDSIMGAFRDPFPPGEGPVLAAFTAAGVSMVVVAFMAVEALMAVEAVDSANEEIQDEFRK